MKTHPDPLDLMPVIPTEKIFCNVCLRNMTHIQLCSAKTSGEEILDERWDLSISWSNTFETWKCQECENVTFRKRHHNSEMQSSPYETDYADSYYPPLVSRAKPAWYKEIKDDIQEVLNEVYVALDTNSRFLASVGVRTALDMLIVDKIGDIGGFETKLKKLQSDGYLDATEFELLETVTEAGNAAAHRGYAPDAKLLNSVVDIMEALFDKFYIKPARDKALLEAARELKKAIPPRK